MSEQNLNLKTLPLSMKKETQRLLYLLLRTLEKDKLQELHINYMKITKTEATSTSLALYDYIFKAPNFDKACAEIDEIFAMAFAAI